MLKINRQTDYAVRVVLALSKKPQGTRVSTSEIGREMLIPLALLQRIVAELSSSGFINTQAGRDGGMTLAHLPKNITLLQIVELFEGEVSLSDCTIKPHDCSFGMKCPVRCQWVRIKNLIREEMGRTTFEQLVEDATTIELSLMTNTASSLPKTASVLNNIPHTVTTVR